MSANQGTPLRKGESLGCPNHHIRNYLSSRSRTYRELLEVQDEVSIGFSGFLERERKEG